MCVTKLSVSPSPAPVKGVVCSAVDVRSVICAPWSMLTSPLMSTDPAQLTPAGRCAFPGIAILEKRIGHLSPIQKRYFWEAQFRGVLGVRVAILGKALCLLHSCKRRTSVALVLQSPSNRAACRKSRLEGGFSSLMVSSVLRAEWSTRRVFTDRLKLATIPNDNRGQQ